MFVFSPGLHSAAAARNGLKFDGRTWVHTVVLRVYDTCQVIRPGTVYIGSRVTRS